MPFSPDTAGQFNLRLMTDLESLGGWSNSDHRASPKENIATLRPGWPKDTAVSSQVDGHEGEGNAEERVERAPSVLPLAVTLQMLPQDLKERRCWTIHFYQQMRFIWKVRKELLMKKITV